ncbi:uncharacterized protein MKK02DRAFT_37451 [Dioszegia hungarica]|uniref:Uncharacterized protein n=1 Tax=Dioszegia hungarica TaxID=4972 RepID=A0AA38LTD5_9TREE|nr:uncharacterized protein MKK02DRAFT_37451 [Dioszegia hungarica]KAI9634573.1 hypothetical protein MKK02DRAFT_37451 [Dioszegia hungarica]
MSDQDASHASHWPSSVTTLQEARPLVTFDLSFEVQPDIKPYDTRTTGWVREAFLKIYVDTFAHGFDAVWVPHEDPMIRGVHFVPSLEFTQTAHSIIKAVGDFVEEPSALPPRACKAYTTRMEGVMSSCLSEENESARKFPRRVRELGGELGRAATQIKRGGLLDEESITIALRRPADGADAVNVTRELEPVETGHGGIVSREIFTIGGAQLLDQGDSIPTGQPQVPKAKRGSR